MTWIVTYTGRRFYPLAPRAEDVDVRDIAHHLSQRARFSGACPWTYSVAQHSCLCARIVPPDCKLHALLHDSPEAYGPDFARPVKGRYYVAGFLGGYMAPVRKIEGNILAAVYESLDLAPPTAEQQKIVDWADAAMLTAEADRFFHQHDDWNLTVPAADVRIVKQEATEAEQEFLRLFHRYRGLV